MIYGLNGSSADEKYKNESSETWALIQTFIDCY